VEPHPSSFHKSLSKDPSSAASTAPEPVHAAPKNKPSVSDEQYKSKPSAALTGAILDAASWQLALGAIKKNYNTLYSILSIAPAVFGPGTVTITTGSKFYKKRLEEARNQQIICDTVRKVTGQKVALKCQQGEANAQTARSSLTGTLPPSGGEAVHAVRPKPEGNAVATISNIFGGAEVLES
jgi:hypothetical protein